eukprot:TRINITY_DN772_c0_g1_i2.p1 TRINITY_DN772_c0_g1~~TRINITY_DN772_c0_g1_i2.p1  ORF type:complete len:382 (+),score=76.22 TRINITY_DN772_c0_g1_i2:137-1147(+)
MAATVAISKKRKFVADGVLYAELNELLTRELAEEGYSGVEVRVTPVRTEIVIRATRTQSVLGEKGRRIRELTAVVQKRFKFAEGSVELYVEKVNNRGLCAIAQAESLRYKLVGGLAVRRACYGVLRFVMESGAKGCEVSVSGKLRAQRAKTMKFVDGYMISSGHPVKEYVDYAYRHVMLRQGVLGIKVKIMLPWDPTGRTGPQEAPPRRYHCVAAQGGRHPARARDADGRASPGGDSVKRLIFTNSGGASGVDGCGWCRACPRVSCRWRRVLEKRINTAALAGIDAIVALSLRWVASNVRSCECRVIHTCPLVGAWYSVWCNGVGRVAWLVSMGCC